MRNIYFVEFGNYYDDEITEKILFPVSAKNLSKTDAEEKLSHLMTMIGKNCIVSILDGISTNEFTEIYDLETEKIVPYNVNFILITCIEREIYTKNFVTFAEAREQMIKDALNSMKDDEDVINDYYEFRELNGNYEGDEFGINFTTAWANADNGDKNYDWRIIVC